MKKPTAAQPLAPVSSEEFELYPDTDADVLDRCELSLVNMTSIRQEGSRRHGWVSPGRSVPNLGLVLHSPTGAARVVPPRLQTAQPLSPHYPQPQPQPLGGRVAQRWRVDGRRRSASPKTTLDTSMRILERMAQDTAVATQRAGYSLSTLREATPAAAYLVSPASDVVIQAPGLRSPAVTRAPADAWRQESPKEFSSSLNGHAAGRSLGTAPADGEEARTSASAVDESVPVQGPGPSAFVQAAGAQAGRRAPETEALFALVQTTADDDSLLDDGSGTSTTATAADAESEHGKSGSTALPSTNNVRCTESDGTLISASVEPASALPPQRPPSGVHLTEQCSAGSWHDERSSPSTARMRSSISSNTAARDVRSSSKRAAALSVSELLEGAQCVSRGAAASIPRRAPTAVQWVSPPSALKEPAASLPDAPARLDTQDSSHTGLERTLHHSNHDIQKIISRADKEALTISVQPYEEVDEDAEVDPLDTTARSRLRLGLTGNESAAAPVTLCTPVALYPLNRGGRGAAAQHRSSFESGVDPDVSAARGAGVSSPSNVQPVLTWRFPLLGRPDSPQRSPHHSPLHSRTRRLRRDSSFASGDDNAGPRANRTDDGAEGRAGATVLAADEGVNAIDSPFNIARRHHQQPTVQSNGQCGTDDELTASHAAADKDGRPRLVSAKSPATGKSPVTDGAVVDDAHSESRGTAASVTAASDGGSGRPKTAASQRTAKSSSESSKSVQPTLTMTETGAFESSDREHGSGTAAATAAGTSVPTVARSSVDAGATINSNSSSGGRMNSTSEYLRRMEMVYAAYIKNQSAKESQPQVSGEFNTASFASASAAGVQPRWCAPSFAAAQSCAEVHNALTQSPTAQAAPQGLSPGQDRRRSSLLTPAMSISGALNRSAGYYSFGNRLSLHHPNRQSILATPQELQSLSHSVIAPRGSTAAAAVTLPDVLPSTTSFHAIPTSDATEAAASMRRRSMDPGIVQRIRHRPLLQGTIFLRYVLSQIRESVAGARSTISSVTAGAAKSSASESHVDKPGSTTVQTAGSTSHAGGKAERAVASSVERSQQPLPPSHARHDGASLFYSPDASMLHSMSSAPLRSFIASNGAQLSRLPSASPTSPLATKSSAMAGGDTTVQTSGADAGVYDAETSNWHADAAADSQGEQQLQQQQQRYCRALTEYDTLVRHVHNIDGYEREVDNSNNDLVVYVGMRLMGWLEVVSLLGCGSFGQVFLCKDLRICDGHFVSPSEIEGEDFAYWNCCHAYLPFGDCDATPTHNPLVAVKVVKSVPLFEQQSVLEAEMLVLVGAQTAREGMADLPSPTRSSDTGVSVCATPEGRSTAGGVAPPFDSGALEAVAHVASADPPPPDARCVHVAKVLADGTSYGHHCIVMERYGANLYEYIQSNNFRGLPMYQVRSIGRQILSGLSLLHEECHIIHADIKPENLLLTLDSCRSSVSNNHLNGGTGAALTTSVSCSSLPVTGATPLRDAGESATSGAAAAVKDEPAERSYIRLSPGATSAGTGGRAAVVPDGTQTTPSAAQSFRHLPVSAGSGAGGTADGGSPNVSSSQVRVPEPQRVHAMNQPLQTSAMASMVGQTVRAESTVSLAGSSVTSRGKSGAATAASTSAVPRLRVKLIDFSSSCYDGGPFYSYIQSRYYRAPEVIVNASYGSGIDTWSTGCVLAELFLGMPLLPGSNDHHQIALIEEMLAPLPASMLAEGAVTSMYYDEVPPASGETAAEPAAAPTPSEEPSAADAQAPRGYSLISKEEFLTRNELEPVEYTRYFTYSTLQDLVRRCPLAAEERRMSNGEPPYAGSAANTPATTPAQKQLQQTRIQTTRTELMKQRFLFFDVLRQLLHTDPQQRLTASSALAHPFFSTTPTYMNHFQLD